MEPSACQSPFRQLKNHSLHGENRRGAGLRRSSCCISKRWHSHFFDRLFSCQGALCTTFWAARCAGRYLAGVRLASVPVNSEVVFPQTGGGNRGKLLRKGQRGGNFLGEEALTRRPLCLLLTLPSTAPQNREGHHLHIDKKLPAYSASRFCLWGFQVGAKDSGFSLRSGIFPPLRRAGPRPLWSFR